MSKVGKKVTGKVIDLIEIVPKKTKYTKEEQELLEVEGKALDSIKFLYKFGKEENEATKEDNKAENIVAAINEITQENRAKLIAKSFNKDMYIQNKLNNIPVQKIKRTWGGTQIWEEAEQAFIPEVINKLPTVKVQDIFKMSEMFNLIVLPIQYVEINKIIEAIKDTKYSSKTIARAHMIFVKELERLEKKMDISMEMYILCPIHCYNIWMHIKDTTNNNNIYFPQSLSAEHTTLSLLLPAQKNLYLAIQNTNENIEALKSNVEVNVQNLTKQMSVLATRIEKLEKESIAEKVKNKQIELKLKDAKEYKSTYQSYDPMVFAVKKGVNILEDEGALAKVGVCWGPDMQEVMLELNELTVKGTEKKMRDTINILTNNEALGAYTGEVKKETEEEVRFFYAGN